MYECVLRSILQSLYCILISSLNGASLLSSNIVRAYVDNFFDRKRRISRILFVYILSSCPHW